MHFVAQNIFIQTFLMICLSDIMLAATEKNYTGRVLLPIPALLPRDLTFIAQLCKLSQLLFMFSKKF